MRYDFEQFLSDGVLVLYLSRIDFLNRYRNSYFGFLWSILTPLTTVCILWFIFTQAFKVQPDKGPYPFIAWLLAGMSVWAFFAEALLTSSYSITASAFVIKKRAFNSAFLPLSKILSSLFSHSIFLLIVFCFLLRYGIMPSLYWLQLPYYMLCTAAFCSGIALVTSSVSVFVADIQNMVSVFVQFFFWATPVFWSLDMLPQRYACWLRFNPMAYVVQGYRDALLSRAWLWEQASAMALFWAVTLCLLGVGALVFAKLKSQFADVL